MASHLNDVEDVDLHMPGAINALRTWLRLYKLPVVNSFVFDGEARDRAFAEGLVEETHGHWQSLVAGKAEGSASSGAAAPSIRSAGLIRCASKNGLASLLGSAGGAH